MKLTEGPHRRFNALTNEWVLVSPHRTTRPWQGAVERPSVLNQAEYDPECYLCPGNARAGGVRNPKYQSTFVFDNDFAALSPNASTERTDIGGKGLIVAEGEPGICRVMCFSPRHDLTLSTMPVSEIESVTTAWTAQFRELAAMPRVRYVQIFENRGSMMGASNPHPHCQIWGTSSVPLYVGRETTAQHDYLLKHSACLLCEYVAMEQKEEGRIVCENNSFVALVPYWAIWPFEVMVCGRRHTGSLLDFTEQEARDLSSMLKRVTSTYDKVFDSPFPYSMGFHQRPTDGAEHPEWHFHGHFYPPLLRSATVRKFMVGFEMLGMPQRDITPEVAAERLSALAME